MSPIRLARMETTFMGLLHHPGKPDGVALYARYV